MKIKLEKPSGHDHNYYLHFGDNAFIQFVNEWPQFWGKYNWYDFTLIMIRFEKDLMLTGYEFEFVILGLGFRIRINDPDGEGYKEVMSRADDAKKEYKNEKRQAQR